MSSPATAGPGAGKKAVHVKWAGKTIALGTFPSAEADEKCQKAKALTRAWRSSMRPKPSREWVMLELERLGVRVVSGRLGRKAGEDGDDQPAAQDKQPKSPMPQVNEAAAAAAAVGMMPQQQQPQSQNPMAAAGAAAAGGAGGIAERSGSIGWGNDADLHSLMAARRNSSLGLSMMDGALNRRGSLSSLGQVMGLGEGEATIPPHRPFVGGGAAAAYEAARHDHFTQKSAEQQRRASSLGLGSLAGGGIGGMNMSVNPNQHYEMLKLHHMNLLNEIQETTLMMNLYQQQQLQQQQQQLQQQASAEQMGGTAPGSGAAANTGSDPQLSMLMQQQQQNGSAGAGAGTATGQPMDGMFAAQRASLGLGGASQMGAGAGAGPAAGPAAAGGFGGGSGGGPGGAGAGAAGGLANGISGLPQQPQGAGAGAQVTASGMLPGMQGSMLPQQQQQVNGGGGAQESPVGSQAIKPEGSASGPAVSAGGGAENKSPENNVKREGGGDLAGNQPSPKRVKTEEGPASGVGGADSPTKNAA